MNQGQLWTIALDYNHHCYNQVTYSVGLMVAVGLLHTTLVIQYDLDMCICNIGPPPQSQLRLAKITVVTSYAYPCEAFH